MKRMMGLIAGLLGSTAALAQPVPTSPPIAEQHPVTETFFGTNVTDPYRWMEDMASPAFQTFMKAEADYTQSILKSITGRDALAERIRALDNATAVIIAVQRYGDRTFYEKSAPGAPSFSIAMRDAAGTETILVDPDTLTHDGHHMAIDFWQPSDDGKMLAYGLSEGGSEESTLHLLDTTTREALPETISRANFASVSWRLDGSGFYYNRLKELAKGAPATEKYNNSRVYLHKLRTDPATDEPVLGQGLSPAVKTDPIDAPALVITPGSDFALGILQHGVENEVAIYVAPVSALNGKATPWVKVAGRRDQVTSAALHGNDLYLLTHKGASRFKVIKTDAAAPAKDLSQATEVVGPSDAVITAIGVASDGLYLRDMAGGPSRLRRLPWGGPIESVALPYEGVALDGLSTDPRKPGALFSLEGWVHNRSWVDYDPATKVLKDTGLQPPSPIDVSAYTAEEVTARSADGTDVPLSIVRRKDAKTDGTNPTLLWGYGAYGISQSPVFAPRWFALLEQGGIWAICHVRGGGEYGEDWHRGGQKLTKPNSWADLAGCAQYLAAHGLANADHLAIEGGSAGGILVGRAMTAHPELYRVVLDDVGVSNPLRSEFTPNGPSNIPEFGSVKTKEGFKGLYEMDTTQHVVAGTAYPAVLITTGINDPRVDPWETAKLAAHLQAANPTGRPVLLRVDYDAGHGIGSTRVQRSQVMADRLAFMFWQMGVAGFERK